MKRPHLGDKLKEYRDGKSWKQPKMAGYLGFALRTYAEIERTGEVKKVAELKKIEAKTGLVKLIFAWDAEPGDGLTLSEALKRISNLEEVLKKAGLMKDVGFGQIEPGPGQRNSNKG